MKKILALASLLACTLTYAQKIRVEVEQPILNGEKDTVFGTLLSQGESLVDYHDVPLVIIIPGSGPTDRDGNSAVLQGPNDSYKQLADSLLERGIATFRYDKPAVGKSTFSKKEEDMRFEDHVSLTGAIISKMDQLGFNEIFLLGHSQGSLVSMLAAQEFKEVDGVISLAGPGVNSHTLIKEQVKGQLPPTLENQTFQKLDSIKAGYTVEKYNSAIATLVRKPLQPYLHGYFKYTPSEEIKKLKVPVLILQGGRDLQIKEKEGILLSEARPKARYILYPEMNHVLKRVDGSQEQNMASYSDPDFPLVKALPEDIAEWVKSVK